MSTPDIQVISGLPNTGLENSSKLVRAVDPVLHFYQFDKHPLASLVMTQGMSLVQRANSTVPQLIGKALRKKAYPNMKVEWFEDSFFKLEYALVAAVATGDTSVTVSAGDSAYFRVNDIILATNQAGQTERLKITAINTTTGVLTVQNPDGTARSAGIVCTTADKIYLFENVRQEDSTAPSIRTTKSANMFNYMEIISEPYGLTKVKRATAHYTGDPMLEEKRKAFSRLLERLEAMFLFGTRALATFTTNPEYHCGGLKYWMETYTDCEIRDMAGRALTKAELDSFLTAVGRAGSPEKVVLCDSRFLNAVSGFGYETVRPDNYKVGEIGANVMKVFGPMGVVTLCYEPLFDRVAPFRGTAMVIDMADVEYCYLEGNGVSLDIADEPVLLANGAISEERQLVGAVGIKFNTLQHFGWLKNIGA